uniref:Uncharacterized protein n=1 Tax=Plectus sambesii TaxID=2011161 RepID=A0A914WVQ9_9BILA
MIRFRANTTTRGAGAAGGSPLVPNARRWTPPSRRPAPRSYTNDPTTLGAAESDNGRHQWLPLLLPTSPPLISVDIAATRNPPCPPIIPTCRRLWPPLLAFYYSSGRQRAIRPRRRRQDDMSQRENAPCQFGNGALKKYGALSCGDRARGPIAIGSRRAAIWPRAPKTRFNATFAAFVWARAASLTPSMAGERTL